MRVDISPEERLERVARLLVKATYLSLDDQKADGERDGCGYRAESGRIADAEEHRERGYAAARPGRTKRYEVV